MTDYSLTLVPLLWPALIVLAVLVFAGAWVLAGRLRGKRAGGGAPGSALGGLEVAAIILLLIGGFVYLVGWIAGAVLLWISPRWRLADKLLGTLVWPGGLGAILWAGFFAVGSQTCSGGSGIPTRCVYTGPPQWVGSVALAVIVLGQIATTAWLWRRARRAAGDRLDGASASPA